MNTQDIIKLARKHSNEGDMASSAQVSLQDALHLLERGFHEFAKKRAIRSLEYSVGIFHEDYKKATA